MIYQKLDWDLDIATGIHPLPFPVRANADDTLQFDEATYSAECEGFIEVIKKELIQLAGLETFVAAPLEKAIDAV